MKYICLVHHDEAKLAAMPDDALGDVVAGCIAWLEALERDGRHVFSAGLQSSRSAAHLQQRDGRVLTTDGPFTETKECLGGFTILEARDFNEALHLAGQLPATRIGRVEVRPILDPAQPLADAFDRRLAGLLRRHSPEVEPAVAARSLSSPRAG